MTTTFYNDIEIWQKFCRRVKQENPRLTKGGKPFRSSSEVLRDLQELYVKKGEKLFEL